MTPRGFTVLIVLPLIGLPLYFLTVAALPESAAHFFVSEVGPIELATALLFLLAAVIAVLHIYRHRDSMRRKYRVLFGLFALAATFVALEELSYGQHLLGFQSPVWFEHHNKQDETNLHNMLGSKPSRRMRIVAAVGFPVVCIVLPLWYLYRRTGWQCGHWTYFLLPQAQIAGVVIVAQLVRLPRYLSDGLMCGAWTNRLGEVRELYWAAGAFLYILILYRRLAADRLADSGRTGNQSQAGQSMQGFQAETAGLRRAA